MENTIKITFGTVTQQQSEMLIAELSIAGFTGFDTTTDVLEAFIPENEFDEQELQAICDRYHVVPEKAVIAPENWNELWESGFEPVLVGDFCSIRAGFHAPVNNTTYEIIITPKMSFGTGHHATTYMMVQLMQELAMEGRTVCDFGTGTGVLAILAEKMGAAALLAVDYDEQCMVNAAENITENSCTHITLQQNDRLPAGKWEIILANINLNVLGDNMTAFNNSLTKNGMLLLSGILETDIPVLTNMLAENNLEINKLLIKNGWAALMANHLLQES